MPHKYLLKEFEEFARSAPKPESLMQHVSERIHMHIPRYNWVGFYLLDKKDPSVLVLGPHVGSFSPNPKIALTQGLCGAAAATGRVVVADNVAEEPRYLQVSDLVKSQISVPILAGGKAVAVMNVESYFLATFNRQDERGFIEKCALTVANYLENTAVRDLVSA
jgi:L-methionine (R)-S-oxide reductase